MPYLVDRSGSAPELIVDLLEKLPQDFTSTEDIVALAHTACERTNYVAFDKGFFEPVAVALVANDGSGASELTLIAVRPDHQSRAVGRRVIARIVADLVTDQIQVLRVNRSALDGFKRAGQFFEALGFVQDGQGQYLELEVKQAGN